MNEANYILDYGIPFLGVVFFIFIATRYLHHWLQLKKAMIEAGMRWPIPSQKELNETTYADLSKGYGMMFTGMGQSIHIIFSMRTDNPKIQKHLKALRRTLLSFILLPVLFIVVLVVVLAFMAV